MEIFIGKTVRSEAARIQAHTGKPLTDAWMAAFYKRRNVRLEAELQAIDGALDAVAAVHARLGGRIACASGADRYKVEMQLQKVGLAPYFAGRVFSGHEMPATKPAPDVYLAAAAALGVPPQRCLVVEDTVTGVTAGVAAGATVVGLCPSPVGHGSPEALRAAGAVQVLAHLRELPALLG
jgi:HAD superfamily hydrolase (TIGR01509 family)